MQHLRHVNEIRAKMAGARLGMLEAHCEVERVPWWALWRVGERRAAADRRERALGRVQALEWVLTGVGE